MPCSECSLGGVFSSRLSAALRTCWIGVSGCFCVTGETSPNGEYKIGDTLNVVGCFSKVQFEMPLYGPLEDAIAELPADDFTMMVKCDGI